MGDMKRRGLGAIVQRPPRLRPTKKTAGLEQEKLIMNLRFLETFVWVARLKSFRLTAEKLFTTQASVSSRIAALEADLGVKLLLRDSRGVSLTPEGGKVLEYAERMLETAKAVSYTHLTLPTNREV